MPKIPKEKYGEYGLESESEEYNPSMSEVRKETEIADIVRGQLSDIDYELRHPQEDPYTGEKDEFGAHDPEDLWTRLAYLKADYVHDIKDLELKRELENKISQVEKIVYKQFIPFIDSAVNLFGWQHSPPEKHRSRNKMDAREVFSYLDQARSALEHAQTSEDEKREFLDEIVRLQEKFMRYQDEPTLFTFEKIEEELQREVYNDEFIYYGNRKIQDPSRMLDHEESRAGDPQRLNLLLEKARSLRKIAREMLNAKIKADCELRAESLYKYVEHLKAEAELPREFLLIEVKLKSLLRRTKNRERVDVSELEEVESALKELEKKSRGGNHEEALSKLARILKKTRKALLGEVADDEKEQFEYKGIDWAWEFLGISRNSSIEDVKKAYRRASLKYHPDISRVVGSSEKMQRINEAYGFVRRMKGF